MYDSQYVLRLTAQSTPTVLSLWQPHETLNSLDVLFLTCRFGRTGVTNSSKSRLPVVSLSANVLDFHEIFEYLPVHVQVLPEDPTLYTTYCSTTRSSTILLNI